LGFAFAPFAIIYHFESDDVMGRFYRKYVETYLHTLSIPTTTFRVEDQ
jgi:hypothetical protein